MALSIKYTLEDFDSKQIINKFEMQKSGNTQLFLANTCFRRMQKYVPFDTGALSTTATVKAGSITYEQPYAHKQYTTHKGNGIRGRKWDEKMKANEKELVAKEVEAYARKMKGSR